MTEEMSEVEELRSKLHWMEHDLEHVVAERDRAETKLAKFYYIADACLPNDIDSLSPDEALERIKVFAK